MVEIGDAVTFVDNEGVFRDSLITRVHGNPDKAPSLNLWSISTNPAQTDIKNGRQPEAHLHVPHVSRQEAEGFYWQEK